MTVNSVPVENSILNSLGNVPFPKNDVRIRAEAEVPELLLQSLRQIVANNMQLLVNHFSVRENAEDFLIHSIVLRDFSKGFAQERRSVPWHQDYWFYPIGLTSLSCWVLIEADREFQHLNFINFNPQMPLGFPKNELPQNIAEMLIDAYGVVSPIINNLSQTRAIFFDGFTPHRPADLTQDMGFRKTIDFRVSFNTSGKPIKTTTYGSAYHAYKSQVG